mgnify:CR=1 FL=1
MKKKVFFIAIILSALGGILSAQHPVKPKTSEQSWRVLAKAQVAFDKGDYGDAIALCEEAKKSRDRELEWNRYVMENTLNSPEVKRKGPFISDLIPVLKEREDFDALEIINYWIGKRGSEYFDNSLPKLYEYLMRLSEYPECDFLFGCSGCSIYPACRCLYEKQKQMDKVILLGRIRHRDQLYNHDHQPYGSYDGSCSDSSDSRVPLESQRRSCLEIIVKKRVGGHCKLRDPLSGRILRGALPAAAFSSSYAGLFMI